MVHYVLKLLPARILKVFATEISPLMATIFQKKFGFKDYIQGLVDCQCNCNLQEGRKVQSQQLKVSFPYTHFLQDPGVYYGK